jgi:hypothetical protein
VSRGPGRAFRWRAAADALARGAATRVADVWTRRAPTPVGDGGSRRPRPERAAAAGEPSWRAPRATRPTRPPPVGVSRSERLMSLAEYGDAGVGPVRGPVRGPGRGIRASRRRRSSAGPGSRAADDSAGRRPSPPWGMGESSGPGPERVTATGEPCRRAREPRTGPTPASPYSARVISASATTGGWRGRRGGGRRRRSPGRAPRLRPTATRRCAPRRRWRVCRGRRDAAGGWRASP